MNIQFNNKAVDVRTVETSPRRFRIGDILQGPGGILLKVVTVQNDCPYFENLHKTKTVVILIDESGQLVPVNGMSGTYKVWRPRNVRSL